MVGGQGESVGCLQCDGGDGIHQSGDYRDSYAGKWCIAYGAQRCIVCGKHGFGSEYLRTSVNVQPEHVTSGTDLFCDDHQETDRKQIFT